MTNKTWRKSHLAWLIIAGTLVGCSAPIEFDPSKHYRITGDATGFTEDWVDAKFLVMQRTYEENGDPTTVTLAETKSSDGKFEIVGEITVPTVVSIYLENDGIPRDRAEAVIELGADLTVSYPNKTLGLVANGGETHALLISSWQFSEEYQTAVDEYAEVLERRRAEEEAKKAETADEAEDSKSELATESEDTPSADQELETSESAESESTSSQTEIAASTTNEDEPSEASEEEVEVDEAYEAYKAVMAIRQDALDAFATDDENPELALLAIELGALSEPNAAIARLDELEPFFTESAISQRITPRRARLVAYQEKLDADKSLAVGEIAPAFTTVAFSGEDVSLHTVLAENEVVLLDFWASWCGPCIKTFPHLKELHAEYGGQGFEIVSVSIDDTNEDWEEASDEHELPWINLGDISKTDGPVTLAYGVTFIPKGYVLDSEGNIIAKDIKTEELEELLASRLASATNETDLGMSELEAESDTEQGS